MNIIKCESPTRVDLAGGTLDLWPLYLFVGQSCTINIAIDIFTRVEIRERSDEKIFLKSLDLNLQAEFTNLKSFLEDKSPGWSLVRRHIDYWQPKKGFELITHSESPVGGGLGGSSSLSITLLKAFSKFSGRLLLPAEMITLAGNIEAQVLGTPTGTQDYYPPIFGGLNCISYNCDGHSVKVYDAPQEAFSGHFFLVYTGHPHHSGLNNWSVMRGAVEKNTKTMDSLKELNQIAFQMKEICEKKQWNQMGPLLHKEFQARIKLSPDVTSPEIEKLQAVATAAGAEAVKICGAGGGGCVMVWSSPEKIEVAKQACQKNGFQVLNVKLVNKMNLDF